MDCKEELLIFAKTGAIFAKCDKKYSESEENKILEILKQKFPNSYSDDIENEIEIIVRKRNVKSSCFRNLISSTKKYIQNGLKFDEKQKEFVHELEEFINEVIGADNLIKPEEIRLFYKWKKKLYKLIDEKPSYSKIESKYKIVDRLKIIGLVIICASLIVAAVKICFKLNNRAELEAFPLSSYTEKMLQFKEIDFSKVLIYGTETDSQERDSLSLYFVKGTAVLRFRGLDNLSIDTSASTKDTLVLNYDMSNQTELPIDVKIIYDENKCRFIDSIEATTLENSTLGNTLKGISTVAGTVGGGLVGNAIGGLFGLEGKVIGLASGAVFGGVGGYIASANFVKNTKIVQDNTASILINILEDAKPIIAAQLLQDETVMQNTDKNELDLESISVYYRQQLADILTNIICNDENNKWKNVEIHF